VSRDTIRDTAEIVARGRTPPMSGPPGSVPSNSLPANDESEPVWEDPYPYPPLRSEAFHGLAGDIVRALDPHTEADPVAVLLTVIAAFGNIVGLGPHAKVGASEHPARLFVLLVGETARGRKGQSLADTLQIFGQADEEWLDNAKFSGLGSGEGLIAKLRDRDDGTHVEKRAFVVEPEMARLLAVAGRDGSTVSPVIRDAWDSARLQVQTKRDPLIAKDVHVSIMAHITGDELRRCLTTVEVANGFANRFLIACVRRSKKLPTGGTLDPTDVARLGQRVKSAVQSASLIQLVERTPAAALLWEQLYNEFPDEPGLLGSLTARAEAQVLRLSVTYALMGGQSKIEVDDLKAAKAVWDYCQQSAVYTFGERFGDDLADRLLERLRDKWPDGLDGTEQRDLFGRHASQRRLEDVRRSLEKRGLAKSQKVPTGGRARLVTYAVPLRVLGSDESAQSDETSVPGSPPSLPSLRSQHGYVKEVGQIASAPTLAAPPRTTPPKPSICGFFTGPDRHAACSRCGASWELHLPSATDSAAGTQPPR